MEENTPLKLGYTMPAEWEEHEGTWISWPKNPDSFPDEILPEVEKTYVAMIDALHKNEKVNLLVDNEEYEDYVYELLDANGTGRENISIHKIHTADVWFRDYGPIFITKKGAKPGQMAFVNWKFNAWGNKYDDLKEDTDIPKKLPISDLKRFDAPMVLEGGSIDVNGLGTCLTTEQCLLNRNRNPELDKEQIEKRITDYLGARTIIWLKDGIAGDDTDGHVDDIARFVNRNTVVCAVEEHTGDANYDALMANFNFLKDAKDQDGNRLKLIKLPMPNEVAYNEHRLPASYANFYMANKTVLMPTFNDANDQKAMKVLQKLFPERKVVGINCRELVYGFGSIHCVTQQQPMV